MAERDRLEIGKSGSQLRVLGRQPIDQARRRGNMAHYGLPLRVL